MGRETYTGDVAFEVRGHAGLITLNRPKALNSLTGLMCESVRIQLDDWADDPAVRHVLIRGAGDRGLCAGGDVVGFHRDMVAHQPHDGGALLPDGTPGYQADFPAEDVLRAEYAMNLLIAQYPKPYVALMDGVVLGGGVGISAHGSHRVVTERSRVGMPETTIGFSPDVGGTYLLAHAPGYLGMHAGLTGVHLTGADAIHLGLADVQVAQSDLEALTTALTTEDVDAALGSVTAEPGESSLAQQQAWIDQAYAHAEVEDVIAALQEMSTEHPEAGETAKLLDTKSPTMLKVAAEAIRRAASLDVAGALTQEFTVAVHALRSHDFREGIRSQVVDKDRNPQWRPSSVDQVGRALVQTYFEPVPGRELQLG